MASYTLHSQRRVQHDRSQGRRGPARALMLMLMLTLSTQTPPSQMVPSQMLPSQMLPSQMPRQRVWAILAWVASRRAHAPILKMHLQHLQRLQRLQETLRDEEGQLRTQSQKP